MSLLETFVSAEARETPEGNDLRNDPRFHALERQMDSASRAARAANGGGEAAVDWQAILDGATELAREGRDLRLLVIVARALFNRDGLAGLAEGIDLLSAALGEHWDHLHPALREGASPREAAVRRINAVHQLESADDGVLCDLDFAVMFAPRGLGPVTAGDLAAANLTSAAFKANLPRGLGAAEEAERVAQHETRIARVATACRALAAEEPDRLAELRKAADAAREALTTLEDRLSGRVAENGVGVRLQALGGFLDRLHATLSSVDKSPAAEGKGETPMPTAPAPAAAAPAPAARAEGGALSGTINSRRDVDRALELIIEFYDRTEPASPIPLLAKRMRKMVPMSFLQLMEEVAPSGMKEFRNIAGVPDDKAK